jgi:hypothetical protein
VTRSRSILSTVTRLAESAAAAGHGVHIGIAGAGIRFLSDHPDGIQVARAILGPYCEVTGVTGGEPEAWTVVSAKIADYAATAAELASALVSEDVPREPVRRWPGDFSVDRHDLDPGYSVIVHKRPFSGFTIFDRDERTIYYLRPGDAFDVSHTEHVLKYPLRTGLRQSGLCQVHAAACEFRGRGLLLMGEKASGKSTLLARFLSRGARQVSNDLGFVRPVPPTRAEMIAFPHITRMAHGTVNDNEQLRDGLAREERTGDYLRSPVFNGGKEEFYFPVLRRIWGEDVVRRLAPLDVIIFPSLDLSLEKASTHPVPEAELRARIRTSLVDDPPLPDWLPFLPRDGFRAHAAAAAESLLRCHPVAHEVRFGASGTDPVGAVEKILDL